MPSASSVRRSRPSSHGTCRCAADIVPIMFKRELDLHQMTFAMGEAVAHLQVPWLEGRLRRTLDADGI